MQKKLKLKSEQAQQSPPQTNQDAVNTVTELGELIQGIQQQAIQDAIKDSQNNSSDINDTDTTSPGTTSVSPLGLEGAPDSGKTNAVNLAELSKAYGQSGDIESQLKTLKDPNSSTEDRLKAMRGVQMASRLSPDDKSFKAVMTALDDKDNKVRILRRNHDTILQGQRKIRPGAAETQGDVQW